MEAVRTAVRTTATIIVWAPKGERAAPLRRDRLEGLKAVGQAGKERARMAGSGKSAQTEGTQPAPKRGRAGRAGAGASATANAGVNAGVNAGHTMLATHCGTHANVQTDR